MIKSDKIADVMRKIDRGEFCPKPSSKNYEDNS